MYDWDENFYEPSEEEIFFDELKDKFKDILCSDVKSKLERLEKENAELRKTVSNYNYENRKLSARERELKYKEENYKKEIEKDFYNKTINEVFENLLVNCEVWYAERAGHEKPKCDLCNDNRELVATYPNGEITTKKCDCSKLDYWYEPMISENKYFEFHKSYIRESYGKNRICLKKHYQPNKKYADVYDCYSEFRIEKAFDKFDDEVKEYHNEKNYGERLGFTNKEECQKYCDWLNENN